MKFFLVLSLAAATILASPAAELPMQDDLKTPGQASVASIGKPPVAVAAAVVVPESDVEIDDTLQGKQSVLFEYARPRFTRNTLSICSELYLFS